MKDVKKNDEWIRNRDLREDESERGTIVGTGTCVDKVS